jgi:hypothetical protein
LVGVAVKVTELPAQTGLADAMIDTLIGRFGFTVIFIVANIPEQVIPSDAVRVKVSDPVYPDAGVQVAPKSFILEKVPCPLSVQTAVDASPPDRSPPKGKVTPPWQII